MRKSFCGGGKMEKDTHSFTVFWRKILEEDTPRELPLFFEIHSAFNIVRLIARRITARGSIASIARGINAYGY